MKRIEGMPIATHQQRVLVDPEKRAQLERDYLDLLAEMNTISPATANNLKKLIPQNNGSEQQSQ